MELVREWRFRGNPAVERGEGGPPPAQVKPSRSNRSMAVTLTVTLESIDNGLVGVPWDGRRRARCVCVRLCAFVDHHDMCNHS